jgi:hypothetical protein
MIQSWPGDQLSLTSWSRRVGKSRVAGHALRSELHRMIVALRRQAWSRGRPKLGFDGLAVG